MKETSNAQNNSIIKRRESMLSTTNKKQLINKPNEEMAMKEEFTVKY